MRERGAQPGAKPSRIASASALRRVVLLAVALGACARPAPAPPPALGARPELRETTIEKGWITVRLQLAPGPAGRRPAVIGSVPDPEALVAAGAALVTYQVNWDLLAPLKPPEPVPPPANTVGVWLLASPTPRTVGKAYLQLIANDATRTIPEVVDYLATVPEVDPARIGVAGVSTTGFTALQAVAADPRLVAATVLVACGDYHTFLHLSDLAMNGAPLDLDPAYDRWLRTQEPVAHPARLVHAAVLMVNGADDAAVPTACASETARILRRAYARAGVTERFRFVLLPGAGHDLGELAAHEVLAWWYRWLLEPR